MQLVKELHRLSELKEANQIERTTKESHHVRCNRTHGQVRSGPSFNG
jgi:hypothetical protein